MVGRFGLWRLEGPDAVAVPPAVISSERRLENLIEQHVEILGLGRLLVLGRQVPTRTGKRIDLLAMDATGDVHVIELKKDKTPRDVVAQVLEYGHWVQDLSYEAIREIYENHRDGADFSSDFFSQFDGDLPDAVNTAHHLVVVATGLDPSTEQIVEYLRGYGVPINVLFFQYLRDGNREYLARSWLGEFVDPAGQKSRSKKQEEWNGHDYFVACGESEHRNWEDMVQYGFVSAGHGEKYRKAMANLSEGARVWAYIPKTGYVGVGRVVAPAVPVDDFTVVVDGRSVPILDAPLAAADMGADAGDPQLSEYVARVQWIDTRPRGRAVPGRGLFANQNVVAKLRHSGTLRRLAEEFDLGDTDDERAEALRV